MRLSDIDPLLRGRLAAGEVITEQPSNYFGDHMYAIATAGATAYVYTITTENLYGIATLDALETWRPGEDIAGRTIDAVLDYARRNGQPPTPPAPEDVFADAIAYLRPLLQEGEALSTDRDHNGDPILSISTQAGGGSVRWVAGALCYSSPYEPGYNRFADNKGDGEELLRLVLREARTPSDFDQSPYGNR